MTLSKRDAVLALLAAGALPPLAYAVAQPRRPAPRRPGVDYMSPELRQRVERLKQVVATTPTDDRNIGERVLVLYDWANAYALTGHAIHPDLVSAVAIFTQPSFPKFGDRTRETYFQLHDQFVRTLAALEVNPRVVGALSTNVTRPFTVDTHVTFEQTYTVGDAPIRKGGGVVAPNHFYFGLGEYQSEDPRADNYITVRTSRPGVELVADTFEVSGMFSGRLQAGYLPRPFFRVAKGQLEPGDRVTVTFGDRSGGSRGLKLIHWSNSAIRFPVWILTEPGGLLLTPAEIPFQTVGGPAVAVAGFAPSVLGVNEPFDLTVRTEDLFRNLATGRAPAYRLIDNGRPLSEIPASDRTLVTVDGLRFAEPGVHRLTFQTADGRMVGQTNPILVEANPRERIFWGETHGHCGYSEGMGQADDYFRFARDEARLDFVTLSEHDLWMDAREWEEMRQAVRRYDKPGAFAAYMGYEWTVDSPFGGHHNVLFREIDGVHPVARQRHPTLPDLYRGLHRRYKPDNVLVIPHAHMTADWTMNDRALEPLVEIVSSHGTFEWIGRNYLSSGFQLGFVGASDDHIGHPGYRPRAWGRPYSDNFGGLAAVMAPDRNRNRLFDAMRDRRTYATNGERIILRTTLNGMRMGVVTPSAAERVVEGQVHGTGPIESITLIKNGRDHETLAYDRAAGEPGEDLIEVRFFSQSEPATPKTPSRAARTWTGRIMVEGTQVLSVSAPQAEAFNYLTEWARPSAAAPNAVDFALRTRGDEKAVRIRVAGGLENVRVRVMLPEARVPVEGVVTVPAPGAGPAMILARDNDPGGELRGAGTFDDKIWVRRIRPTLIRDRTFRFVDRGAVRDGDNYYVRVVQSDGGMAWSSPGWVGAVKPARLTARLRKAVEKLRGGAA